MAVETAESADSAASPRGQVAKGAALVTAVVFALLLGTSPRLPMVWDEGNAIFRASGIINWIEKVAGGELAVWDRQGIDKHWQYTTKIEGHPAFYGTVIASGLTVANSVLRPLDACRLGPMMLFGFATGAMFYRLHRHYDRTTALVGVAAMLLLPRLFAHAHFASFDSPLVACWILTWVCFDPARRHWGFAALWGIAMGMTMSCKLTGWGAIAPFLIWMAIFRDRAALKAVAVAAPMALVTFVFLNPPLWHAPISGSAEFFRLYAQRPFSVPTQFFGEIYNLDHPLPWYNTLVWLAASVPIGFLALSLIGTFAAIRDWNRDPLGILILGQWAALLVVRALPVAPPHDAVRLILPSFPFFAIVVALGVRHLFAGSTARWKQVVVTAIFFGSASNLLIFQPQWLSYYSLAIGGLPGAVRADMEPTYYWDALDQDALDWLADNTDEDSKVMLSEYPAESLQLMRTWQIARFNCLPSDGGTPKWHVVQRRPSKWTDADRWLVENAEAAYVNRISEGGWGPWRLDIPLLQVFTFSDYLRAEAETSGVVK